MRDFVDPVNGLDRIIPLTVLRRAKGFAIFSIFRLGFLLTARAGSGVVVAKNEDGTWSAPSALGIGGIGGGFSAGAEVTDFIVVLNSRAAVRSFMATGSLQLGGNLSVAVGPLGRSAEASGALNSSGKVAAMFSYSKSQGLFGGESQSCPCGVAHRNWHWLAHTALPSPLYFLTPAHTGVSLEGTILVDRSDANSKAYGRSITAKQILSGNIEPPAFSAGLIGTIERLSLTGRMAEAARADEIEPGAGRDSWSMDEDDNGSRRSGIAGTSDTGLEKYFSQAELDSRQRRVERGEVVPGASQRREQRTKPKPEKDPFATSEDEDAAAYSLDRDNATRNAGTYAFSGSGGGSITNSPNAGRGTDYGRQRAGSKSSFSGYFDDIMPQNKEKRSYSPINGKRPSLGHRKASSSFSIPKFGKNKTQTPPPFGSSRRTPPPESLLGNGYEEFHGQGSSSEDDLGPGLRNADPSGPFGAPDFQGTSSRASPRRDPYANGGLRKTTPADAVRAASRGENRSAARPNTDAFGDLWNTEKAREASSGLDSLDRELQRNNTRKSTFDSFSGPSNGSFQGPARPSSGSLIDRSKFSKSPSTLSKTFRTGSGGAFRSFSYNNKAEALNSASSEDEDRAWGQPYSRGTTPRAYTNSTSNYPSSVQRRTSPFDDDFFTTPSVSTGSPATTSGTTAATSAASSTAALAHLPSQGRVIASYDFQGQQADDLSFGRGEVLVVLKKTDSTNDWWLGKNTRGQVGSFPANFVEWVD